MLKDKKEMKELTFNFLEYDNLLSILQDSEDDFENIFDIGDKNIFTK